MLHFGNIVKGEISMFGELPVPSSQLLVWVFFPHRVTEPGLISQFDDTAALRREHRLSTTMNR